MIATAVICHALWSATATAHRDEGLELREPLAFVYTTTSLKLDFLLPTPVDASMTLRARVLALAADRASVTCSVFVEGRETARAKTDHSRISLQPA